jgi:hypothetical protein
MRVLESLEELLLKPLAELDLGAAGRYVTGQSLVVDGGGVLV